VRGVFVKEQLEFRLEVTGDEWRQGDELPCTLSIKNHAASKQSLQDLYLHLACGQMKKVKQREDDAFEVISSAEHALASEIEPGAQESFSWTFQLDKNCPISDKAQSLHLLCGKGDVPNAAGLLPVTVHAHEHIKAVLSLL